MSKFINPGPEIATLAAQIRSNPHDRAAIADAFDLIAVAFQGCEDCGAPEFDDLPEIGESKDGTTDTNGAA